MDPIQSEGSKSGLGYYIRQKYTNTATSHDHLWIHSQPSPTAVVYYSDTTILMFDPTCQYFDYRNFSKAQSKTNLSDQAIYIPGQVM